MWKGDLDNTTPPRVYIVYEGTLARLPEKPKGLRQRLLGDRLSDYVIDDEVMAHVWDIWQRVGVRFDAVTFRFDADEVQELIDGTNLPIHSTWYFKSREGFIQALPRMPWVMYVVDHQRPLGYGGRASTLEGIRRG